MFPRRTQVSLATYLALSATLVLLGLLWLLRSAPTTHAQSQPEALGSFSGTVRNKQGDPLPNINVSLLQDFYGPIIREVTSNAQGEYQFLSVAPGTYKIRFEDMGKTYGTKYYADSTLWSTAGAVNVSGNNVTGLDMALAPGGIISVTVQPTVPITNSNLVLTLFAKTETNRWELVDTIYWPYLDQELTFYGIPDGTYTLCARLTIFPTFSEMSECYDNTVLNDSGMPPTDATDIVVSAASHHEIALQFGDFSQLQGTVLAATGQPLADIQVNLTNKENYPSNSVSTDAQGQFRFPRIADDTYILQAVDGKGMYMTTYYDGASTVAQGKPLNINSTSRYSLTVTMQQSGYITGTVRLEGGGIPGNAYFSLFMPLGEGAWVDDTTCFPYPCPSFYEPTTGVYTITGLITGIYRVQATEWYQFGRPNVIGYYGGNDLQSADDVFITTGKVTPNINITLGADAFNSTIMGSALVNGIPKPGIDVGLFQSYPYGQPPLPFVSTITDAQGNYRFDGLPNGSYQVGFHDPQGKYAITFYGGSIITPTNVGISSNTTIGDIDGVLTPGSTIRGKVKRAFGKNPADFALYVTIANFGGPLAFTNELTEVNGSYEITGLPPGTYRVGAISPDPSDGTSPHFYPSAGFESDESNIIVGENMVIEGIDIPFDIVPSAYLPQVNGNAQIAE